VVKLSIERNIDGHKQIITTDMTGPHYVVDQGEGYPEGKVAVILDGELCQANADPINPLELRNLPPGKHTLHAFLLKSSAERYKDEASFQTLTFTVNGSGYLSPQEAAGRKLVTAFNQCLAPPPRSESIDPKKPLLIWNRPLELNSAGPIMIDFWLLNARLRSDGGEYRVRLFVDDDDAKYLDKWEPVWLKGWTPGLHTVRLELLGPDQYPVPNGGRNIINREITIGR